MKHSIVDIAEAIRRASPAAGMSARIVAIDGGGGAGKSSFAHELSTALHRAPIVATDDFASSDNQFEWWPRLIDEVLGPLARGDVVRYRRCDWRTGTYADWVDIPPAPEVVIVEGVGAMRREFDTYLAYRVWLEAPESLRLQRGLERDGDMMRPQWERWMAAEDAHFSRDRPIERADVVVSGGG